MQYSYSASGAKLQMKTLNGATVLTTTEYVGNLVYESTGTNPVTLKFYGSTEGRVLVNGSEREYQYSISDHQGNTRIVFTSKTPAAYAPIATFEGTGGDNSNEFKNVANVVPFVAANQTPGGNKVVQINQSYPVGPSKSIKVYPGDKVDMEVYAYYETASGYGTNNVSLGAMITSVAGAFTVGVGSGEIAPINSGVNAALTAMGLGGNRGDAVPAAYLNYILFDKDYNYLNAGWQAVPSSANFAKQKVSIPTRDVTEAGYIFVYLSYENQSNNHVYFDDFKITHTKTNVIQSNDYYPFGLSAATSWTREGSKNDFMYNAGSEINVTTGWYDLPFRNYDPALGRFVQVDPMSVSEMATYQYVGNNPVMMNDPMGLSKNSASHQASMDSFWGHVADGNKYSLWGGDGGSLGEPVTGGGGGGSIGRQRGKEFIDDALDSEYGGHWQDGQAVYYDSYDEANDYFSFEQYWHVVDKGNVQDRYEWEVGYTAVEKEKVQLDLEESDNPWYEFLADGNPGGDFLYELNKLNPLAVVANSLNTFVTGKDLERGKSASKADAAMNIASIIPIGRIVTVGKLIVQSNALTHIFKNAVGHVNPETAASQLRYLNLFSSVASNPRNLVPTTNLAAREAGVETFKQIFNSGEVWVQVRNGQIFNAGVNKLP